MPQSPFSGVWEARSLLPPGLPRDFHIHLPHCGRSQRTTLAPHGVPKPPIPFHMLAAIHRARKSDCRGVDDRHDQTTRVVGVVVALAVVVVVVVVVVVD